jgi:predicted restriction endonuclease
MSWKKQENFWRQALSNLNTWKRGDQRAVHKPLLTLMLIARAATDGDRHIRFAAITEELTRLLKEFGPHRTSYHPEFPFWHLQTDGFWVVEQRVELSPKQSGLSPTNHHVALDAGALGFNDDLRILVSCDVNGQTMVEALLYRFAGQRLRLPQASYAPPARDYVTWHRKEVFHAPAHTGEYPCLQDTLQKAAEGNELYTDN